jgi:catechol 2,3-dioxygenase-like lactoylglutathione lyase family enzyme
MSELPLLETQAPPEAVRFHLSLNVDDLAASIEFFTALFDVSPARREPDYAKFELAEPPLVLSLEPSRAARGGKLNHLGFRLRSSEELVSLQRRLEMHGIRTVREEGVACCYSRQTKFWVTDPDGNLWEMYTLEEDAEPRCSDQLPRQLAAETAARLQPAGALWMHRLSEPFPKSILADDAGTDEVLLEGTCNARFWPGDQVRLLAEVARILRPGGTLTVHGLTAATTIEALAEPLAGPAAIVERVPSAQQLAAELAAAGFVDLYFAKLGGGALRAGGVECRETRLVATKPAATAGATSRLALYRGPAGRLELDGGRTFERGRWTEVDDATWRQLQAAPLQEQFAFSPSERP